MQSVMRLFFAGLFLSLVLLPYAAPCGSLDICCISGGEEGAGTGTVIRGPNGTVVLFDEGGGASWAEACDNLMEELEITQIDYAIASHYDLDHIGGLDDLDTTVVKCYDRGGSQRHDGTDIDTTYLATVSGKRYTVAVDGSTDIDLGEGAILRFLSVGATNTTDTTYIKGGSTITPGDEDNKSITALISYCGFDFYVGGDAMGTLEQAVDGVVEGLGRHEIGRAHV